MVIAVTIGMMGVYVVDSETERGAVDNLSQGDGDGRTGQARWQYSNEV